MREQTAVKTPQSDSPAATGLLQRKCACGQHTTDQHGQCTECNKKGQLLQRRAINRSGPEIALPTVHERLRASGRPLDAATRADLEPRFGHDFSRVRVHTGAPMPFQAKLTINKPGDKYEQEADRIADQVMRMPDPAVQRQTILEEEKEDETLQMKPLAAQITPLIQRETIPEEEEDEEELLQTKRADTQVPTITSSAEAAVQSVRHRGGRPLDPATRAFMEPRFGHDFRHVRVHTGPQAVEAAQAVRAHAFTIGPNMAFGHGQYAPETTAGRRLLAHELAHVVQQGGDSSGIVQLSPAAAAPVAPSNVVACTRGSGLEEAYGVLSNAQSRAAAVAERLERFRRPKVKRAFRQVFGNDDQAARDFVKEILTLVHKLKLVYDPAKATNGFVFYGCAQDSHPRCRSGAAAFYQPAESQENSQTAPPTIAICTEGLDQPEIARETIVLHELIHAVRNEGMVDIYTGTRLYRLLGQLQRPDAGPSSLATVNPDSIVEFVYRSLATFRGIGAESVDRSMVVETFGLDRRDRLRGFAGRRAERRAVRVAIGLVDQWLELGAQDFSTLEKTLDEVAVGHDTWSALKDPMLLTAALMAGGEVISDKQFHCPAGHLTLGVSCPDKAIKILEQDRTAVTKVVGLVRNALNPFRELTNVLGSVSTPEPGARLAQLVPQGEPTLTPRQIQVHRTAGQGSASFHLGEKNGEDRSPDRLMVPESLFALPTIGEQAEEILQAVIASAGGQRAALASLLRRNGSRADRDSTHTLGRVESQSPPS
jgi:hypothetical protein